MFKLLRTRNKATAWEIAVTRKAMVLTAEDAERR